MLRHPLSTRGALVLAVLASTSAVACRDKERPEPAPKTEATPAPAAAPVAPAASAVAAKASGPKLTEAECQKVVDHVLDVTAKEALDEEGTKLSAAEKKKHLAALRAELANDPELKKQAESCDDEYTRSEYVCMMSATTSEALDKCNESRN